MIHRDDIDEKLKNLAFEFFYWFSRFEFALKENGQIHAGHRDVAQADWKGFIGDYEKTYQLCDAAQELLRSPPDVQRVTNESAWEWAPLTFGNGQSGLSKVVLVVKTVRNNLFHGGKHGAAGWDEPERVRFLLERGVKVLDSFARLAHYEADYERRY